MRIRLATLMLGCTLLRAQDASLPLESVALDGTSVSREVVLEMAGLRIGAPVDKAAIEAACAKLKDSGIFESIAYRYAPGPKHGYAVTLTLSEPAALADASIDLTGVDENELWRWLASRYPSFQRQVPGNDAAQEFVARQIEAHLGARLEGQHVVARMEWELRPVRRMIVSFQPETLPGIAATEFTGQHELSSEELAGVLEKAVADLGYTGRRFREVVELSLRRAYEEHGMYRVRFPSITPRKVSPASVVVTTAIEEGPKFTLHQVQLIGENLPAAAMLQAAKFRKGEIANWTEIEGDIWELEKPLKRTGYFDAAAKPERVFDDERLLLDLRISFALGALYRFGQLRVIGLAPPLEAQARKIWKLQPGDPFDYDYPSDFFREFFRAVDARQFKKFDVAMQKGSGDHVMDFNLVFEPK